MKTYTVHEPAEGPTDRLERGEQLVFVREGFSWMAALFGPLWMIGCRLWLALLAYVAALVALQVLVKIAGLPGQAATWMTVAGHLLIGFEADSIRRWTLRRRGYQMIGSVSGTDRDECERRFFDAWLDGRSNVARPIPPPPPGPWGTGGRLSAMAFRSGRT